MPAIRKCATGCWPPMVLKLTVSTGTLKEAEVVETILLPCVFRRGLLRLRNLSLQHHLRHLPLRRVSIHTAHMNRIEASLAEGRTPSHPVPAPRPGPT
jgi:hypothetical protein